MFAVIKTGGKQYRVNQNDVLRIEKLDAKVGEVIVFPEILAVGGDAGLTFGTPTVAGASVAAEVVEQDRDDKVIAFKKRRRQNSKRKRGHRQHQTVVRISEILTGGAKPSKAAAKSSEKAAAKAAKDEAPVAAAAVPAGDLDASNLSLISGIGPTIEKKLRAAGINSWNDIAAWTEADIAKWDEELSLRGRATREEWVVQAKELLDGKPPRAKVDQAEQASGKDL
ncbi:50S ribosomal protein L21 [Labrys sp. LIt4]|uniref:Large ribosomal subunit protein bL21 n=1 Tax=Labrys okinawensis TaxID=346911 RepID=A0A2S9QGZ3_9HYPH|nr:MULTISPECIES: 50S ribosomal protein L21 [Labrys]MBP0579510.1 50S ribosomal protein L21 [Labrys sp. LIt4]PRH88627.1 50S ribosomal protein L21 [Labrys okinawensis]